MLPKPSYLKEVFKGASLFYQPKDIVGGDFYWILDRDDSIYWAVIDCTGHGVPGGFMSMIGNSILNEIVSEQGITEVDEILNTMRDKVIKSINGDVKNVHEAERKDGMDVALCKMDKDSGKLEFAGANLNAYVFHQGELVEIQGEPQPVGAYKSIIPFQKHSFATEFGDSVYIFTDGYPDQFGGIKHKKFKYRRMRKLLNDLQNKTMPEQEQMVAEVFKRWKGETHQTDDVSFLGIKL
jgi:serine phosphatase RsbU (regulator of sigma subunit)